MNVYFIFEGKTEPLIYKHWFKTLLPNYTEIIDIEAVTKNNFYAVSNMGQPACYHNIAAAIQDINIYAGFDSLVLCIDSEELSVAEKITEIQTELARILRHKRY